MAEEHPARNAPVFDRRFSKHFGKQGQGRAICSPLTRKSSLITPPEVQQPDTVRWEDRTQSKGSDVRGALRQSHLDHPIGALHPYLVDFVVYPNNGPAEPAWAQGCAHKGFGSSLSTGALASPFTGQIHFATSKTELLSGPCNGWDGAGRTTSLAICLFQRSGTPRDCVTNNRDRSLLCVQRTSAIVQSS